MQVSRTLTAPDDSSERLRSSTAATIAWPVDAPAESAARQRAQRRREQRQAAAETSALAPNSTQLIESSERRIETGSRTFNRLETRGLAAQQADSSGASFRAELRQAAEKPATQPREASPASPGQSVAPGGAETAPPTATHRAAPTPVTPFMTSAPEPRAINPPPQPQSSSTRSRQPMTPTHTPPPASQSGPRVMLQPALRSSLPAGVPSGSSLQAAAAKPAPTTPPASVSRPLVARENSTAQVIPPRAKAAEPAPKSDSIEQVVRVIRQSLDGRRQVTTLHLNPQDLGKVRIHLDLDKDVLNLRIEPQTEAAHRLLNEQRETLRQALRAAGIELATLDLRAATESREALQPAAWMPLSLTSARVSSVERASARQRSEEQSDDRSDDPGEMARDRVAKSDAKERRGMDALTEQWA